MESGLKEGVRFPRWAHNPSDDPVSDASFRRRPPGFGTGHRQRVQFLVRSLPFNAPRNFARGFL